MLNFFRDNSRILSKLLSNQFGAAFFSVMMLLAIPDTSATLGLVVGIFCVLFLAFLNHVVLWEDGASCRIRADAGREKYNPLKGLYLMLTASIPNFVLAILCALGAFLSTEIGWGWTSALYKFSNVLLRFWEAMYVRILQAIGGSNPYLWLIAPVPVILLGFISYWLGLANCRAAGVFSGPKTDKVKKKR